MAEARVANTEGKLADYNQKLNKRTEKLNELHIKLKLRKDKMIEREERLRQFEKGKNYINSKPHTFFIEVITFVKTPYWTVWRILREMMYLPSIRIVALNCILVKKLITFLLPFKPKIIVEHYVKVITM